MQLHWWAHNIEKCNLDEDNTIKMDEVNQSNAGAKFLSTTKSKLVLIWINIV